MRQNDFFKVKASMGLARTYSTLSLRFSTNPSTWSNLVVNKLRAVRIPPLGPRLYLRSEGQCDRRSNSWTVGSSKVRRYARALVMQGV